MTAEQIIELIMPYVVDAVSIISFVGVVLKVISQFKDLKKEVTDMKSIDTLKDEIKNLVGRLDDLAKENKELKRKYNETMTKIDHVRRNENE